MLNWLSGRCRSGLSAAIAGYARRVALLLVVSMLAAGGQAQAQLAPEGGFSDLVKAVGPAVVNIATRKQATAAPEDFPMPQFPPGSPFEEFFDEFFDREQPQQQQPRTFSLGSGFIIDPAGFVVTNNHVIAEADEITVGLSDDSEYAAELIGRDPKTDLALLKIERDAPFPFVEWADSEAVEVGDWMLAIGNPFGLGFSVTAGIISARGRDIRAGPYDDFFQVDAAINRGNSGGPSFTMDGKVFGVNTAIFSPSGGNVGIGFAIPSNLARNIIASLKDNGRVARGWLGVRIQSVTDEIAESLGLEAAVGALVATVTPGGPAEQSGIKAGDVILRFDGKSIDRMRSLPRIVAETDIGKAVDVDIWRRGEEMSVKVNLGELPDDEELAELGSPMAEEPAIERVEALGLAISPITDETRAEFDLADTAKGVLIVDVDPDSPAAEENLRPGDVIVEIGQEEVNSPADVRARVAAALDQGQKSVLLLIDRQGGVQFVALRFIGG